MKPEGRSQRLLAVTRSKAKMYEYDVPEEHHIQIPPKPRPELLFTLSIGLLGELAARVNSGDSRQDYLDELSKYLQFSTRFFDAYLQARFNSNLDPYLILLGSASYYLCDLPGSSQVLVQRLAEQRPDLGCLGLERLLLSLLMVDLSQPVAESHGPYVGHIHEITRLLHACVSDGEAHQELDRWVNDLRQTAYGIGTPRQLLFADICCAIVRKRVVNSACNSLPEYSGLSIDNWRPTLQKSTFVRELLPAQHILGRHGVFHGNSALVQMPTSAGKTKATEIIIRSALMAGRVSLAVIVAPFRTLSHQIRNDLAESFRDEPVTIVELSDVLQADFDIMRQLDHPLVLVVTPEKLVYALRHTPDIAQHIGLLIYDEGHQFDSGARGITYELLLTSLKKMVHRDIQTVLISAVIQNAEDVGRWLIGEECQIVSGAELIPTYRSLAFASWRDELGRLVFVNKDNPEEEEYFVPRIIERQTLRRIGRERKERAFPEGKSGPDVALYLGLKTVRAGGVAIFCGTKVTASKICRTAVDAYERGLSFTRPAEYSDRDEVVRLCYLHERNLGEEAPMTTSANLGVFCHHANTPHGIRLAVEYAMKKGLARFVVCTSTLAQGVNLPIRYLIVTSTHQGRDHIKVRDFHNLIGRAGRSGMYTEGSILFADPQILDGRRSGDPWRWRQVKELLDPSNSEACSSTILSIFEPFLSNNGKISYPVDIESLIRERETGELRTLPERLVEQLGGEGFSRPELRRQIRSKDNVLSAIESYLMALWDEPASGPADNQVDDLAQETLGYFLPEATNARNTRDVPVACAERCYQCAASTQKEGLFQDPLRRSRFDSDRRLDDA